MRLTTWDWISFDIKGTTELPNAENTQTTQTSLAWINFQVANYLPDLEDKLRQDFPHAIGFILANISHQPIIVINESKKQEVDNVLWVNNQWILFYTYEEEAPTIWIDIIANGILQDYMQTNGSWRPPIISILQ